MSYQKETDYTSSIVQMSKQGYNDLMGSSDGKNLHWTTDINVELPIKISSTGIGSSIKPETLSQVFCKTVAARQDNPALRVMRNNREYVWTWNDYFRDAFAFARSLQHIGIDERKAVNIMGFNSPEWFISFFGSILHNNVVSGVYITNGS
mgnify:CR=1 FL=1